MKRPEASECRPVPRREARWLALATLGAAFAAGGCDAGGNRPLTVVSQAPTGAGGQAGAAGAAGAAGTGAAAGTSAAAGVTGGTSPTGGAGPGVATGGTEGGGGACWASLLPAEPQPSPPTLDVAQACQLGANAASWTFPTSSAPRNDNRNGELVGRWLTCGAATIVPSPHAGIEFGGNGRWQLLQQNENGEPFVPAATTRGYYYVLGSGQLNLPADDSFGLTMGGFVVFANGNHDVVRFDGGRGGSGIYVRIAPSPSNGDENVPPVSDGHCSMVGTWDVSANTMTPVEPASVWSFDEVGNFVVGAPGDDLCGAHTMRGTYALSNGFFRITSNWNLGLCDWWFTAAYPYKFTSDCSALTTTQMIDNCTGGRGYLNGTATLRRRW